MTHDEETAMLKRDGRRKYVETGGVRGPNGYEPTRRQYVALLKGEVTGAELLAKHKDDDADYDDNGNLRAGCDHNEMEPIHAAADARFEAGSPTLRDGDDYND